MYANELKILLHKTIPAGLPVLVTGSPGVAKTSVCVQACESLGVDYLISHPVVEDPTDLKGLPFPVNGRAEFLPIGQFDRVLQSTDPLVWIIDDLGQAAPSVQAAYMQLLLARELNGQQIPKGVCFLACTNRRQDKASVAGILEPVKSRFATIVNLDPDIESWATWAIEKHINPMIIGFLRFRPVMLNDFQPTNDLINSPIPRTWQRASELIDLGFTDDQESVEFEALKGCIGESATLEFLSFRKIYKRIPDLNRILIDGDYSCFDTVRHDLCTMYSVCAALVMRCHIEHIENCLGWAATCLDSGHSEFGIVVIKDLITKFGSKIVCETRAYSTMATGNHAEYITGLNHG